jgi:hypothetical protein
MIYLLFKNRTVFLFAAIPLAVFYILTIMRLHFVAQRYFVPTCTIIAMVTGFTLAAWLRAPRIPAWARYAVIFLICGLTVLYCIGLKLEMRNDTRHRLEVWVDEHVDKNALIGCGMRRWYAPRVKFKGYKLIDDWCSKGVETNRGIVKVFPDYLIMSRMFPCTNDYRNDSVFKNDLYEGKGGYIHAAEFKAIYTASVTPFSIAGWPYWINEGISPTIDIFRRNDVPERNVSR